MSGVLVAKQVEIVPQAELSAIITLDEASRAAARQLMEAEQAGNEITKALILARAMKRLKELLSDRIMGDIMELKGSAAGFKTDEIGRKGGAYTLAETRSVIILALIRGLRVTGNEINIIASNLYVTKEGFERLLRDHPGLSNLKIQIGVPQTAGEGALVPCRAEWCLDGVPDSIACEKDESTDWRIPIRVNSFMGVDAIIGKAKSKLLRRIYERVTGSELLSEADAEIETGEAPVGDTETKCEQQETANGGN